MKTIIAGRWTLTMTEPVSLLAGHGVLIAGTDILAVAPLDDLLAQHPDAQIVDRPDHVIMPGLINAHSHAAMHLLRGVGDDLPLMQWLQNRIWPLEGALVDESFVYDGTLLASAEMLLGGTTTFNDMYFYPSDSARAAHAMGSRIVAGITLIGFPTRYATDEADYLRKGLAARDAWKGEDRVHWSLGPHAPYTVSDAYFKEVATLAEQLDLPIHVHIHETSSEIEDALARDGKRPLTRLAQLGILNERLMSVHSVHLDDAEIAALAHAGASVVHCPASNMKLASGFCRVNDLNKAGVNVCIGTDGAASNNRQDMWSEARLAALLAKGVSRDASAFSAVDTLKAMTVNPARALMLDHRIGQLKPGLAADIIAVEVPDDAAHQPVFELLSHLVYVTGRGSVTDTWVNGDHVVQMRQLQGTRGILLKETLRNRKPMWQTRIREALQGESKT